MNLTDRNHNRYVTVLIQGGVDVNNEPILKEQQILTIGRGILHIRVGTSDDPANMRELSDIHSYVMDIIANSTTMNPAVLVTTERVNIEFIQL